MDQQQKKTLVRARFRNAIQGFGLDIQGVLSEAGMITRGLSLS